VFNLGSPKTPGQWIAHTALGVIALLLIVWMMRTFF
jgi:hypothetical protein